MEESRSNLKSVGEALASIGVIVGGFGSLAVLFFWIGNVIIIARLREYGIEFVIDKKDERIKEIIIKDTILPKSYDVKSFKEYYKQKK